MRNLTVQQRKMLYAGVAVLLLVPIVILGGPAGQANGSGGVLAQLRDEYELGESSLGDVDPTGASVNLVLLGFRGIAASILWQQADEQKKKKDFAELENTVESIILLQPHYKAVWKFQSWTLAFNVSAECDAVEDRYHWVKQGAKFSMRGTERNHKLPELHFQTGEFFVKKIGRADEREVFREYFLSDPDVEQWKGGPDENINPQHKDNYLVARDWYLKANEIIDNNNDVRQHQMDIALFMAYPYRSLIDYAVARQTDGLKREFDLLDKEVKESEREAKKEQAFVAWSDEQRTAWEKAYNEWTTLYGTRELMTTHYGRVVLEIDDAKLRDLAEQDGLEFKEKKRWQMQYRKLTNYPYWKKRCDIEKRDDMMEARFRIAEGRRLFDLAETELSAKYLFDGLTLLEKVVDLYEREEDESNALLDDEDEVLDDAFKALIIWQNILKLDSKEIPADFPMKKYWEDPKHEARQAELLQRYQQVYGGG